MRVAVIPARGGSKRIPRKNIRSFGGKPMIAWALQAAMDSDCFDRVLVSSDDDEVRAIAVQHGAEAPFVRPATLADDHTGTSAVVAHAIDWLQASGCHPDLVCCIYPTAPFLLADDLRTGLQAMASPRWQFAFSVTDFEAPVFRSFVAASDGGVSMLFPEHATTRSQDLPLALHDAAQFYWGRAQAWLGGKAVFDRDSFPVRLPRWRVQDIDTEEDFIRAEMMLPGLMPLLASQKK
ncbi:MAG TPA: pseudaminic acid cytidylyltransferase [Herbaspirillum sp.]|jgi:N-acylneuraminate cytidylyltransferase